MPYDTHLRSTPPPFSLPIQDPEIIFVVANDGQDIRLCTEGFQQLSSVRDLYDWVVERLQLALKSVVDSEPGPDDKVLPELLNNYMYGATIRMGNDHENLGSENEIIHIRDPRTELDTGEDANLLIFKLNAFEGYVIRVIHSDEALTYHTRLLALYKARQNE